MKAGLHVLACLLLLAACGRPDSEQAVDTSIRPFERFAEDVFLTLQHTPLDGFAGGDADAFELGLFGNLNVMAGENVVMGRYRYRVDTLAGVPIGHMAFWFREADGDESMPVVLSFERARDGWMLREAVVEDGISGGETLSQQDDRIAVALTSWARRAAEQAEAR